MVCVGGKGGGGEFAGCISGECNMVVVVAGGGTLLFIRGMNKPVMVIQAKPITSRYNYTIMSQQLFLKLSFIFVFVVTF